MNKEETLEYVSQLFLLVAVFFLPFSTALMTLFLWSAITINLLSGQWIKKIKWLFLHPVVIITTLLFIFYALGILYNKDSWLNRLEMLARYHTLLLIPLLIPFFNTDEYRKKTIL